MRSIRNSLVVGLISAVFMSCGASRRTTSPRVRDTSTPGNIRLTRTKGQRGKHFSTRIRYNDGTFISTPKYHLAGDSGPLPPGLSLNEHTGLISGTPTQSGFWSVVVMVGDRHKGSINYPGTGAWPSYPIEIKIFDKLTDER